MLHETNFFYNIIREIYEFAQLLCKINYYIHKILELTLHSSKCSILNCKALNVWQNYPSFHASPASSFDHSINSVGLPQFFLREQYSLSITLNNKYKLRILSFQTSRQINNHFMFLQFTLAIFQRARSPDQRFVIFCLSQHSIIYPYILKSHLLHIFNIISSLFSLHLPFYILFFYIAYWIMAAAKDQSIKLILKLNEKSNCKALLVIIKSLFKSQLLKNIANGKKTELSKFNKTDNNQSTLSDSLLAINPYKLRYKSYVQVNALISSNRDFALLKDIDAKTFAKSPFRNFQKQYSEIKFSFCYNLFIYLIIIKLDYFTMIQDY